jgi:dienelactone hydrolase
MSGTEPRAPVRCRGLPFGTSKLTLGHETGYKNAMGALVGRSKTVAMVFILGQAAVLLAVGCHTPSPRPASSPTVSASGPQRRDLWSERADGDVIQLRTILLTARSEYFALTYWSGGLRVNGFLGRPLHPSGRLPAIVWNRGGNRDFGATDGRWMVPYVEAGYVAVGSQYRGGGGSEGTDTFGGADVEDVLNLVALLKRLPEVDPARIGMVGYSRGGMMTYRALREDARRGLNDIRVAATVGGGADIGDLDERPDMLPVYLGTIGCAPWACPEEYADRSAVNWAGELRAPLLLLHGEADDRVSVDQSRRLAEKMSGAGRTVKLIAYPGDDHGLTAHDGGLPEILRWMGEHLGLLPDSYSKELLVPAAGEVLRSWPMPAQVTQPDPATNAGGR